MKNRIVIIIIIIIIFIIIINGHFPGVGPLRSQVIFFEFYKTDTSHVLKTGKNLKTRATSLWTILIIGGNSVGRQLHACVFGLEETL